MGKDYCQIAKYECSEKRRIDKIMNTSATNETKAKVPRRARTRMQYLLREGNIGAFIALCELYRIRPDNRPAKEKVSEYVKGLLADDKLSPSDKKNLENIILSPSIKFPEEVNKSLCNKLILTEEFKTLEILAEKYLIPDAPIQKKYMELFREKQEEKIRRLRKATHIKPNYRDEKLERIILKNYRSYIKERNPGKIIGLYQLTKIRPIEKLNILRSFIAYLLRSKKFSQLRKILDIYKTRIRLHDKKSISQTYLNILKSGDTQDLDYFYNTLGKPDDNTERAGYSIICNRKDEAERYALLIRWGKITGSNPQKIANRELFSRQKKAEEKSRVPASAYQRLTT